MQIEEAYRTLDLKRGATLKEVVEARDDLLALWNPERLTHHPRLRTKAAAKIQEVHEAYAALMQELGDTGRRRTESSSQAPAADRPAASLFDEMFAAEPSNRRWKLPLWAIVAVAAGLATGVYFLGLSSSVSEDVAQQSTIDSGEPLDAGAPAQGPPESDEPAKTEPNEAEPPEAAPRPTPPARPPRQPSSARASQPEAPAGRGPVLLRREVATAAASKPEESASAAAQDQITEKQRQAYQSLLANSSVASRLVNGGFENLRFLEWNVVKQQGAELWIDLTAEGSEGVAAHFIWSVNPETSTVRALSSAARDLERSGGGGEIS